MSNRFGSPFLLAAGPDVGVHHQADPLEFLQVAGSAGASTWAPIRTGFVLTHRDLQRAGDKIGLGVRRGERRYTLRALVQQDPSATLGWLAAHARRWSTIHRTQPLDPSASRWWSVRAARTATVLEALALRATSAAGPR